MLTTLPFFRVHRFFEGINGYAVMFYPLVGALLGGLLYLAALIADPYLPHTQVMILILGLWVVLTGALHLDGLADTFDALFVSKERREAVLKDPHIGAMGAIFTALFLILKAAALWHLQAVWLLPLVLIFSRLNAVAAIFLFQYIRPDGMGSLAKKEFKGWQFLFAALFSLGFAAYMDPFTAAVMSVTAVAVLLGSYLFVRRQFGGFSGDLYGFLIEVTELVLLHLLILKGWG